MARPITIDAGAVQIGDRIYNRHAYHPRAAWVRVTEVLTYMDGYVCLQTAIYDTWKHSREGIAVLPLRPEGGT